VNYALYKPYLVDRLWVKYQGDTIKIWDYQGAGKPAFSLSIFLLGEALLYPLY
jgi:hypothetical protein